MQQDEALRYNFRLLLTPFHTARHEGAVHHALLPRLQAGRRGGRHRRQHAEHPPRERHQPVHQLPVPPPGGDEGLHRRGARARAEGEDLLHRARAVEPRAGAVRAAQPRRRDPAPTGPGGGFSWLQEHLGSDYIAAWFVPELKDAAVINTGVSRWHNYYVEGLNWLARNVGIDGLYIDDVAFDRTTMKRVRKVLDRNRPGALIDLHSANQFNVRDGFASSANLYLEHFPYPEPPLVRRVLRLQLRARLLAGRDLRHPVRPDGRDAAGQRQPVARDGVRHDRPPAVGRRPAPAVEGVGRVRHRRQPDDRLLGGRVAR